MTNDLQRLASSIVLAALLAAAAPARADLIGVSVTGTLKFLCQSNSSCNPALNYFDPANGFVPSGAGNASGPTVPIVDPGVEFQYDDTFTAIDADFGPSSLSTVEVVIQIAPNADALTGWSMMFTGLGAAGALTNVVETSNTFPGLTFDFDSNSISLSFPGAALPPSGSFSAAFSITQAAAAVDEPTSLLLLAGAALAGLSRATMRRRRA